MKGKEEASERMRNKIEASQLSDTEFKVMVSMRLQGNYNELTAN